MNLKRSVLYGALFWVILFILASVLLFGFGLDSEGMIFNISIIVIGIIVVAIVSHFQFKKERNPNGLMTGIVYALVSIILDAVITVPLFINDYAMLFNLFYLISVILGIITVVIVAGLKKK